MTCSLLAAFLLSVAQVESGANHVSVHSTQMSRAARHDHGTPQAHLAWIQRELVKAGIDPSPFNSALVWRCGLSTVLEGRVPVYGYLYALRVEALTKAKP